MLALMAMHLGASTGVGLTSRADLHCGHEEHAAPKRMTLNTSPACRKKAEPDPKQSAVSVARGGSDAAGSRTRTIEAK
ncbi:unnamed protein product [Schistocephalus solidus]|uniref:Secreted protein n=1 Tax=Schistocephalus solidus TaxID=70667 RepID=A0A183SYL3_SCHSO|nr:unnamed protein product [Schistocephalus solidus]